MVDVVVYQRPFRVDDRFLDGVELLCEIEALAPVLDHLDHRRKMTVRSSEALHDLAVRLMQVWVAHWPKPIPEDRTRQPAPVAARARRSPPSGTDDARSGRGSADVQMQDELRYVRNDRRPGIMLSIEAESTESASKLVVELKVPVRRLDVVRA
jgi:hypothetical protein